MIRARAFMADAVGAMLWVILAWATAEWLTWEFKTLPAGTRATIYGWLMVHAWKVARNVGQFAILMEAKYTEEIVEVAR